MKRLAMTGAAVLTVPAILLGGSSAPAQAVQWGSTNISHYSPDAGYDEPIRIRCNGGREPLLNEGERSLWASKCGPSNTYAVLVRSTEDLVCLEDTTYYGKQWHTIYRTTGWHTLPNNFDEGNYGCVLKLNQ